MGSKLDDIFITYCISLETQINSIISNNCNKYYTENTISKNVELITKYNGISYYNNDNVVTITPFKYIPLHKDLQNNFQKILEDKEKALQDKKKANKLLTKLQQKYKSKYFQYLPEYLIPYKPTILTPDKELTDLLSKYYFFSIID